MNLICSKGHVTDGSTRQRSYMLNPGDHSPAVPACLFMEDYPPPTRGRRECGCPTREATDAEVTAYRLGGADALISLWEQLARNEPPS